MQLTSVMENQFGIGKIVWVYRTGSEGEIIKTVNVEHQTKYHVRVPSEDETYLFGPDDLFLLSSFFLLSIRILCSSGDYCLWADG